MTGTIDLSIKQFSAIIESVEQHERFYSPIVRLVIHPVTGGGEKTVRVDTYSLSGGDVLQGHFFLLRDGTCLTGKEYNDLTEGEVSS